jgi:hypothetical protein
LVFLQQACPDREPIRNTDVLSYQETLDNVGIMTGKVTGLLDHQVFSSDFISGHLSKG